MREQELFRDGYSFSKHGTVELQSRQVRSRIFLALASSFLLLALLAAALFPIPFNVASEGILISSSQDFILYADHNGRVLQQTYKSGEQIQSGDTIAIVHDPRLNESLDGLGADLDLKLQEMQLATDRLNAKELSQKIRYKDFGNLRRIEDSLYRSLQDQQQALSNLDNEGNSSRIGLLWELYESGLISEIELRNQTGRYVESLERIRNIYLSRIDRGQVAIEETFKERENVLREKENYLKLQSYTSQLKKKLSYYQKYRVLNGTLLNSPVSGQVFYLVSSPFVEAGDPIAAIRRNHQVSEPRVLLAKVSASQFEEISIGQRVFIALQSQEWMRDRIAEGEVKDILQGSAANTLTVIIDAKNVPNNVPIYSKLSVKIQTRKKNLLSRVLGL